AGWGATHGHRSGLGDIALAAPLAEALLIALHGESRDGDHRDTLQLVVFLQPLRDFEPRYLRKLNVHEDQAWALPAGGPPGLPAVSRLERLVAVRVEEIVEELHIELVILDDQD